ncbi:hypothetical protein SAMN05421734_10459 [Pelagirhabdus alkalitolerans]|uniref:Membrane domain of glycerophosphoryl diester phosphodiesterase n=1 Tax=Pelagirhabdus alkalitolerans TaxID=1612202 RepID=A0A1G6IJK7_9BACI|nr:hypothetical protein [Pelagirhabdus alkalitolerans]SDC06762.1 hypothetical protein SAMN05421734_10459 [Pelagirhabdus alkalitolerans]
MEQLFERPKKFGEIIDLTFYIVKKHFGSLLKLLFILFSPILLIQIVTQFISGRPFFTSGTENNAINEQLLNMIENNGEFFLPGEFFSSLAINLLEVFIYPLAIASVLIMVKQIMDNETYDISMIIKNAFKRFWPLVGTYLLLGVLAFLFLIAPLIIFSISITIALVSETVYPIILSIILMVVALVLIGLLFARWGLSLAVVTFHKVAPGLGESFRITQKRSWLLFWLFLTLLILTGIIRLAADFLIVVIGFSILYSIISFGFLILSYAVFMVGYAVIYFDAVVRSRSTTT